MRQSYERDSEAFWRSYEERPLWAEEASPDEWFPWYIDSLRAVQTVSGRTRSDRASADRKR